jgi:hypothetical protein
MTSISPSILDYPSTHSVVMTFNDLLIAVATRLASQLRLRPFYPSAWTLTFSDNQRPVSYPSSHAPFIALHSPSMNSLTSRSIHSPRPTMTLVISCSSPFGVYCPSGAPSSMNLLPDTFVAGQPKLLSFNGISSRNSKTASFRLRCFSQP